MGHSPSTVGISCPLAQMELRRGLQLSSPGADKLRCSMDLTPTGKEGLLRAMEAGGLTEFAL